MVATFVNSDVKTKRLSVFGTFMIAPSVTAVVGLCYDASPVPASSIQSSLKYLSSSCKIASENRLRISLAKGSRKWLVQDETG